MPRRLLRPGRGGQQGCVGVEQCAAHVGDVDYPDEAVIADHGQVPEPAAGHGPGRVRDAGGRVNDDRAGGHQVMDPHVVEVLADSEIYVDALKTPRNQVTAARQRVANTPA